MSDLFDFDEDDEPTAAPPPRSAPVPADREGFDKTGWGDGPWQGEPDRVEWIRHDVPCLMIRHPSWGSWCGYAGVEPGHRWYGKANHRRAEQEAVCHGGITFCGPADENFRLLSHPDKFGAAWWIGFDCGHAFDFQPGMRALLNELGKRSLPEEFPGYREVYRDQRYVTAQVNHLAQQIIDARGPRPRKR